jgi:membrane fusion protein (multidrug efflux system)
MKIKSLIILVLVISVLLGMKFIFFPSESAQNDSKSKGAKGGATSVAVFVATSQRINNDVYATGTVLANEQVQLQTELSGKLIQLNFQEGARVSKGQLLVKINDADLQANYKKLQLQLALADEKLQRQKKLLTINGISQEDLDIAQNQYNVLKAELDYAAAQIAKTEIRAPFDGVIGLKNVSEGAYVTPATIIATIQQINPVKIDFAISEKYASLVKKGDNIKFTIDGVGDTEGIVLAIEPKIEMATRTLQIRAICSNPKNEIFPGAFARVKLALSDIDHAIMIPTEAVIPDLKGKKVYKIKNGMAEPTKIITGLRNEAQIQIVEGVVDGDTIVTRGIMQLKPGAAVKITEIKK